MKTIKINNLEISISEQELARIVKENEALLKPEVKGRYFFPKVGDMLFHATYLGKIYKTQYVDDLTGNNLISTGNCYRTREEAELALKKQQAIVRCWKWRQENAPFEPDWEYKSRKWIVAYDCVNKRLGRDTFVSWVSQFTLPYFKSEEDCEAFIQANKEDLLLLFTK